MKVLQITWWRKRAARACTASTFVFQTTIAIHWVWYFTFVPLCPLKKYYSLPFSCAAARLG
jgi:hypothetical protein